MHPSGEAAIIIDAHGQSVDAITIVAVRNDGGINRKRDSPFCEGEPWKMREGVGHSNALDNVYTRAGRIG